MCEYMLKVPQYRICNVKEAKLIIIIFLKVTNTNIMHEGKTRHMVCL